MAVPSLDQSPTKLRGRDHFAKYYFLIKTITKFLFFMPKCLLIFWWKLLDNFPGKVGAGLRYCIAKRLFLSCGINVYIGPDVEIKYWEKISFGSNVSIHRGCYIDAAGNLSIHDDVSIAHSSTILTSEHTWSESNLAIRDNPIKFSPVVINRDVWVGCGVRILSGVTVASRVIVAAGAIVNKSVPSGVIVGGVPAKTIKEI